MTRDKERIEMLECDLECCKADLQTAEEEIECIERFQFSLGCCMADLQTAEEKIRYLQRELERCKNKQYDLQNVLDECQAELAECQSDLAYGHN